MATEEISLKKVCMASDVFAACVSHCLTTEKEEVMGLLIGEVHQAISQISALAILPRSVVNSNRVEISTVVLTRAMTIAEKLSAELEKPMTVIGWYHSRPHNGVQPSEVDLETQFGYQYLEPLFVGLIFAVYPDNADDFQENDITFTCFQAVKCEEEYQSKNIELQIDSTLMWKHNLSAILLLPKILLLEQEGVQEWDEQDSKEVDEQDSKEADEQEGKEVDEQDSNEMDEQDSKEVDSKKKGGKQKRSKKKGSKKKDSEEKDVKEEEFAVWHNDTLLKLAISNITSKVGLPLIEHLEASLLAKETRITELEQSREEITQTLLQ